MTLIQAVDLKKNNECCSISATANKSGGFAATFVGPNICLHSTAPAYFCTEYVEKNLGQFVGILTLI